MTKRFTVLFPATFLIFLLVSCDSADRRQHAVATPPPAVTAPALVAPAPSLPPESTPPLPPQPEPPKPDPVAQLIERVEKEYQAGQANYVAGHLEAAKQNFDRAFNLLTESKLDVQNEPRLQREFD